MKRLILAIAAAATTLFAPAAIKTQLGFEGSDGTPYDSTVVAPSTSTNYPFADFGSKYLALDDKYDVESVFAQGDPRVFDMYVQFTAMTETPELPTEAKIAVYADGDGNLFALSDADGTVSLGTVELGAWVRLTIVSVTEGYDIYVDGDNVGSVLADENATTVEFTGSGKLDNFVARTTNPFGGEPTGWIAKEGNDPEQYFTDYTDALKAALAGSSLTFADGETEMDGTAEHPFEIRTAADLVALQQAVATTPAARAYNYRQTANIDMTGADAFAGIGVYNADPTKGTPFTGTYDGRGFKISNVTMTGRNYGGIFNQVNGGTIKNLTVENISTAATSGEFGYAIVGNAGNGATLENLTAAGTFLSSEKPGTHNMAGIVVRACGGGENGTLIKNCTNNAAIYGAYTKLGGICAIVQHKVGSTPVTFKNCSNTGALDISYVNATENATGFAGILAYSSDDAVLEGCSNTGTLTNSGETENDNVKGALVGTVQDYTLTLKSAIASGDIGKFNTGCTVALDFNVSGDGVDFNLYGATGTTVELLQDFTGGYPVIGSSIAPALKLSANMTINNGNKNITNATFAVITGTGNLTMSNAQATRWYVITKLQNYSGVISAGSYEKVAFGDIVAEAGYGTALVKAGSNFNVDDLASTKVNGASASLVVDTVDNQKGIYLVAAQVVADDESTTGYATVENALDAADAAYASTVNVLAPEAAEVEKAGWSYANGVYTSTRVIASLNSTGYPSLAKALAAAHDGDTVTLVAATSEAVTIPAGVTVAVTDDVVFSGKLSGAGAIKYTKVPQTFPASTLVAGEWAGTFIIAYNQETSANIAFNSYGISGSYVEIAEGYSLTGHCVGGTLATLVVNGTLNIVDGSSTTMATIYALAGSGNVSVTQNRKYTFSNLVDWNGKLTSNGNLITIGNITSGAGSIEYQTTPAAAPTVGEDFEGEVYLNFNYSNYDVYKYAGANATVKLGTMTGHLHDGAGTSGQTGEIPGKTVVSGTVVINNGWTIGSADWTAAKVVKFDSLKVDGSLTLDSTATGFGTARSYYYAKSLDATVAGTITVGDGFGLRIDAVDFAEAPSDSGVLVRLTLDKADLLTTDGQLFGTGGKLDGSIAVTVNGEATEQTLVYNAAKGGLVLYVAPIAFIYDENGNLLREIPAGDNAVMQAAQDFLYMEVGESIKFASSIENTEFHAMFLNGCTYDATTFTYTRKHEAAVAKITVGQKDYTFPTLAAAIEAAQDGETVVLLADITLDARVEPNVGAGTALTIDLGGYTITREGTGGNGSVFDVKSGNVVITNGVIDCTQDDAAIVADGVYAITARSGANVTLGGLTITVDSQAGACVYPFDGATVTILSGTYRNDTQADYQYHAGWRGMAVNQANVATQLITIYGGSFKQVNPALGDDSWADGEGTFLAEGYETSYDSQTGYYVVSKSAGGFPGGADGKTFTIDDTVQTALEAKLLSAGKALSDTVEGTTSGLTYAQAYALGLFDEDTETVEDVKPTIEIVDGKVVVSLDATAKAGYKVMLNVYEKSSLTAQWPTEPTKSYELDSAAEAAGFAPSAAGAGFYKVGVTIEDAE